MKKLMGKNIIFAGLLTTFVSIESADAFLTHDQVVAEFDAPTKHHVVGFANGSRAPASFEKKVRKPLEAISSDIPSSIDLRKFDAPVVVQPGPTCTAFGTAAAMDNFLRQNGINKSVSEQHLWSLYEQYDVDAAVAAASLNFLTEEQYWPINESEPNKDYRNHRDLKLMQYTSHDDNLNAALIALSQNHPLIIALQVSKSLYNCDTSVSPTTKKYGGGHVVEVVGYKIDTAVPGGGYLILKNSWGTECGDQGYQYYPFSLCARNDLYCDFIEVSGVQSN